MNYRNSNGNTFVQALSNKRSVLVLLKNDNGTIFGGFTQARLYYSYGDSNDFTDRTSFLFNLLDKKSWRCVTTFDSTLETVDYGSSKWLFFSENDDLHDLAIRNTNGFQAANSRSQLGGYNVPRDANRINQLTKKLDGQQFKVDDMEIWEI